MKTLPSLLTSDFLKNLTEQHIKRYESMLRAHAEGAQGIRPGECGHLLAVWKRIKESDGSLAPLDYSAAEISEIEDAWFDEYDSAEQEE